MRKHKQALAAGALAAAVAGGSLAVAVVNPLAPAGAREGATAEAPTGDRGGPSRFGGAIDDALAELVADGTLTQDQADAVRARVGDKAGSPRLGDDAGPHRPGKPDGERPDGERPGRAGPAGKGFGLREAADALAQRLGLTVEELRDELVAGKSLRQVAEARGVSGEELSQLITDEATTRLDQAVADGKLTQEQADQLRARLAEHLPDLLDRSLPTGGHRPGGQGGAERPERRPGT